MTTEMIRQYAAVYTAPSGMYAEVQVEGASTEKIAEGYVRLAVKRHTGWGCRSITKVPVKNSCNFRVQVP